MEIENQPEVFVLSPEQQETLLLLERLFGRAIANRYVDFLRLAASATGLRVSRPLAGHALRELESMIRSSLVVPMDVTVIVSEADQQRSEDGLKALAQLDFDETALQRAAKALAPQHSHSDQIKLYRRAPWVVP